MGTITIKRLYDDKQTTGDMIVSGTDGEAIFRCFTMELAWNDNKQNASCIPEGKYYASKRTSEKYGNHFILHDVPNRSYILIHVGNFYNDLLGCIAPGLTKVHINQDKAKDVGYSGNAMDILNAIMPDEFEVEIKS